MPRARSSSYGAIRISHEQVERSPDEISDFKTRGQELVDSVHICNEAHRQEWLHKTAEGLELAAEFRGQVTEINISG